MMPGQEPFQVLEQIVVAWSMTGTMGDDQTPLSGTTAVYVSHEDELQWPCLEVFEHPYYSPGLAPIDSYLFQHLKSFLAGQHFPSDDDMQTAVTRLLRFQATDFIDTGIQELVSRFYTGFKPGGFYVER
ncbi:hypothetical protein AVEN_32061-1 [Araneus ventricosus]|uniref:Histone-lysine N-methyltransferase SETMAR n=1 Tax=Araneus ventricosus TaxID=182803 RepID=A0A4Y2EG04_ARAVE|nr:hypothetical protein AVEN_32061-1 [Araneus ventricosus]